MELLQKDVLIQQIDNQIHYLLTLMKKEAQDNPFREQVFHMHQNACNSFLEYIKSIGLQQPRRVISSMMTDEDEMLEMLSVSENTSSTVSVVTHTKEENTVQKEQQQIVNLNLKIEHVKRFIVDALLEEVRFFKFENEKLHKVIENWVNKQAIDQILTEEYQGKVSLGIADVEKYYKIVEQHSSSIRQFCIHRVKLFSNKEDSISKQIQKEFFKTFIDKDFELICKEVVNAMDCIHERLLSLTEMMKKFDQEFTSQHCKVYRELLISNEELKKQNSILTAEKYKLLLEYKNSISKLEKQKKLIENLEKMRTNNNHSFIEKSSATTSTFMRPSTATISNPSSALPHIVANSPSSNRRKSTSSLGVHKANLTFPTPQYYHR